MKTSLRLVALPLVLSFACSGGSAGKADAGGSGGAAGGGVGGKAASGGASGTGGGSGGVLGSGGASGSGGGTGGLGSGGAGAGGGATGGPGSGGAGGAGSGGAGGVASGGAGGQGDSGGRVGSGGKAGGGAGGSGGVGGVAGRGGGGSAGRNGGGGSAGGASGGGTGGGTPSLRVTSATAFPASQPAILGLRVAVDSQDTAVVMGPSASNETTDPGPTITWMPLAGSPRQKTFATDTTPSAMAVDSSNAVWLVGQLIQPTTFGGTTIQPVEAGYYLVKLAADGTNVFTRPISRTDANVSSASTYAIAFDSAGNAYVAGNLYLLGTSFTASVFVTKFSPTGTQLVDRVFPGTDSQASCYDVAVAPNGDVVIGGQYNASLQFGSTKLTSLAGIGANGFVAVLNGTDLTARRAISFGGTVSADLAYSVDVTSTGAFRIAGGIGDMSTIGGMTVQADATGSAFVAELSPTLAVSWLKVVSGKGIVFNTSTSSADRTFAAGRIDGTTSDSFLASVVGPAPPTLTLPLRVTTGDMGNGALSAAADKHGGVWVAGELAGMVNFGTGPIGSATATKLTNFLVHLEP